MIGCALLKSCFRACQFGHSSHQPTGPHVLLLKMLRLGEQQIVHRPGLPLRAGTPHRVGAACGVRVQRLPWKVSRGEAQRREEAPQPLDCGQGLSANRRREFAMLANGHGGLLRADHAMLGADWHCKPDVRRALHRRTAMRSRSIAVSAGPSERGTHPVARMRRTAGAAKRTRRSQGTRAQPYSAMAGVCAVAVAWTR